MTAVADKKRKRARQKSLSGVEPDDKIKEIEDAALDYEEARDERQAKTQVEKETKERLIDTMKRHKKKLYKFDGRTIVMDELTETKVKVKKDKTEAEEDEDE